MLAVATAEGVAFIGAGATIVAALLLGSLAAWNSGRRQKAQIEDAGERQKRELTGEAERQAGTLAHDRQLSDLADLRALLDETAIAIHEARKARDDLRVRFTEHGAKLPQDVKTKFAEAGQVIDALTSRILIRLGVRHSISQQFAAISAAMLSTWHQVGFLDEDAGESLAPMLEFDEAMAMFFVEAVKIAGTVPALRTPAEHA